MNSDQAKQLNLPEILARLGHQPTRETKGGRELWYKSPFRQEKEASFHTSFLGGKWIWNDFGDRGGTVIDFVLAYKNYHSVSQALAYLSDLEGKVGKSIAAPNQPSFSFQQQAREAVAEAPARELQFLSAKPVTSRVIRDYLVNDRGIHLDLIEPYLLEIRYKNLNNGNTYFGFGTKNIAGGYEVRVASDKMSFKSALIERSITVFEGKKPDLRMANVFEGVTDHLSLLTMMKTSHLVGDAIVLNSLTSYDKAVAYMKDREYTTVNLFLDNDKAGREYTKRFIDDFGEKAVDQSSMFLPFKDLNEYIKPDRAKGSTIER